MHEFEFDPAARADPRCPPGTGFVIAAISGVMFWIGVALGIFIGWMVF